MLSFFVAILSSEVHLRLLFSIISLSFLLGKVRMKTYDLIVENLILCFLSLGVAALFVLESLTKTLDGGWWCFDILSFDNFAAIRRLIACCFVIVFLALEKSILLHMTLG